MTVYASAFTTIGLQRLEAATVLGTSLNLTTAAFGDGGGAPVTPSLSQLALVREVYRTTLNRVVKDPADPTQTLYYLEMLIPANVGGFVIREFAVFDDQGHLCVTGNFPEVRKTLVADRATSDLVIRVQVRVSNLQSLTLQIDPAVAVATQAWVLSAIRPATIFPGGTTFQVLRKRSNTDGDTEWADPASANLLVNTIEETQAIAAGQTVFNLTSLTTLGLAVYVKDDLGGERIPRRAGAGGWQQGASNTQVILGTSYAGGGQVTFVQNEAAGNLPRPLEASLNLSDVADAAASRNNLGVYDKASVDQKAPPGLVAYFALGAPPSGWLAANGAAVSRTTYAALFGAMGTLFGAGDGSTTFNLPDLRGEFLRGVDSGRGVDIGRALGSAQAGAFQAHKHITYFGENPVTGFPNGYAATNQRGSNGGLDNDNAWPYTSTEGGTETRPRNIALLACIRT